MIQPGIFKRYDIRGKVGDAITEDVAEQIGRAFGSYLRREACGGCGRPDSRLSSRALADAAIRGLADAGVDGRHRYGSAGRVERGRGGNIGGLMITGSHLNPNEWVQALDRYEQPVRRPDQALRQMIDAGELLVGAETCRSTSRSTSATWRWPSKLHRPPAESWSMPATAWAWAATQVVHGDPPVLQRTALSTTSQSRCGQPARSARVVSEGADLGWRSTGTPIASAWSTTRDAVSADRVWCCWRAIRSTAPGATVVADVLSAGAVRGVAKAGGGRSSGSADSLIKAKMAGKALLGGEMSGHIFMGDRYCRFDDGVRRRSDRADPRRAGSAAVGHCAAVPTLYSTPEYHCPDERKSRSSAPCTRRSRPLSDQRCGRYPDHLRAGLGAAAPVSTERAVPALRGARRKADALAYKHIVREALVSAYPEVEDF